MDAKAPSLPLEVARRRPRPLSQALIDLAETAGPRISVGDLAAALSDRSFGAFMILMAAPNLVPLPPGSSTVFAIPLLLIAVQLAMGRDRLWLPAFLGRRSIDRDTYGNIARRLEPILRRVEELVRPRLFVLTSPVARRAIGILAFILAIVMALPIPLGNFAPAAAVVAFGTGLTERDGIAIVVGGLVSLVALGLVAGVSGAAYALAASIFR